MDQNSLFHSHPTCVDSFHPSLTYGSSGLHLLVPGWGPLAWPPRLQLGFCRALCIATSDSTLSWPPMCVCLSVCLSPALPPSSPLTPLLTCPPAPDEQSIWNVTVLPNSKWANVTWKHNFGPGTDFVVEYIDSKHCCAGRWWRQRQRVAWMPLKRSCELPQAQRGLLAWLNYDLMKSMCSWMAVRCTSRLKGKEGASAAISGV